VLLPFVCEFAHASRPFLAANATQEHVEANERQIQEIRTAIAEADAGDFATDAEVKAVVDKWSGHTD
jgi:RHH-type transcriptional regulator, rel operon repressor / antitoxin RelB